MKRIEEAKKRFLAPVVFVLALLFAWPVQAMEPKSGGTLVFGAENEFAGFDALKARGFAICDAIANAVIQERLFDMAENGELIPVLGLTATASEDQKTWTITLRRGVVFHDGTPFNADAVVAHWSRLLDPKNRFSGRDTIAPIEAVEKVGEFTVRFSLAHPWLPFLQTLCDARTLAPFVPSPKTVAEDAQNRAPVGTGPFMFKEWLSGDRFVVIRNPGYWKHEKPHLDEIVFKFMPDHQTRFASLESGQADMIWTDRGAAIEKAEKDPNLVHFVSEGTGAEIFILNTAKPPLDDPRVRKALAYAWNQQVCVSLSYQDCIPVVTHPFGNRIGCGNANYPSPDFQKAKELIAAYGRPVEIECLHSNTKRGQEQGELLQQFAKEIGVTVRPIGMSFGPVVKKVITGDYKISTWRIPAYRDQGPSLYSGFQSASRRNWSRYQSPEMDRLLLEQNVATDSGKRDELLCRIAVLINEDVPIIYRGGRRFHVLSTKEVKGAFQFRNGIFILSDLWLDR
jgi:ABC-type transport system substrate-binding protein